MISQQALNILFKGMAVHPANSKALQEKVKENEAVGEGDVFKVVRKLNVVMVMKVIVIKERDGEMRVLRWWWYWWKNVKWKLIWRVSGSNECTGESERDRWKEQEKVK